LCHRETAAAKTARVETARQEQAAADAETAQQARNYTPPEMPYERYILSLLVQII